MTEIEIAVAVTACIAFAIGSFAGHAVGYGRGIRRRTPRYRRVGRPATYEVISPSGLYIHTPSRASAEAFAAKYGGSVRVGRPE